MRQLLLRCIGVCVAAGLASFGPAATTSFAAPQPRTADEAARIGKVVAPATDFSKPEKFEERPGGAATFFGPYNQNAFSQPSANMSFERRAKFNVGNGIFRKVWVPAPSSTQASDGLGPVFNARSCQRCHLKDGRGHPPSANYPDDTAVSMFLRLSIPPQTDEARAALANHLRAVEPEPTYGGQLQDFGVQNVPAEGRMHITYEEQPVTLADGTVVSLRKPTYKVTDLAYGPMHPDVMISPRVAPMMIGLGLLEDIPAEDILAHADPDDADGDGISGKPNYTWDIRKEEVVLGRFGWKAGQPTIEQQSAGAFGGDIGISNALSPANAGDCMEKQAACRNAPHGGSAKDGGLEAGDDMLEHVTFYSRNLAVPARRDVGDPQVLRGKKVFYESGCASCHVPKFVTARDEDQPEQSFQLIWPYSDLLLHDMGEGLADHRPEGNATGTEWRTAPLWGIGLTKTVNDHTFFLHDGRARSLLEAVLWHGGEAEAAKEKVVALPAEDREALIRFLESL